MASPFPSPVYLLFSFQKTLTLFPKSWPDPDPVPVVSSDILPLPPNMSDFHFFQRITQPELAFQEASLSELAVQVGSMSGSIHEEMSRIKFAFLRPVSVSQKALQFALYLQGVSVPVSCPCYILRGLSSCSTLFLYSCFAELIVFPKLVGGVPYHQHYTNITVYPWFLIWINFHCFVWDNINQAINLYQNSFKSLLLVL